MMPVPETNNLSSFQHPPWLQVPLQWSIIPTWLNNLLSQQRISLNIYNGISFRWNNLIGAAQQVLALMQSHNFVSVSSSIGVLRIPFYAGGGGGGVIGGGGIPGSMPVPTGDFHENIGTTPLLIYTQDIGFTQAGAWSFLSTNFNTARNLVQQDYFYLRDIHELLGDIANIVLPYTEGAIDLQSLPVQNSIPAATLVTLRQNGLASSSPFTWAVWRGSISDSAVNRGNYDFYYPGIIASSARSGTAFSHPTALILGAVETISNCTIDGDDVEHHNLQEDPETPAESLKKVSLQQVNALAGFDTFSLRLVNGAVLVLEAPAVLDSNPNIVLLSSWNGGSIHIDATSRLELRGRNIVFAWRTGDITGGGAIRCYGGARLVMKEDAGDLAISELSLFGNPEGSKLILQDLNGNIVLDADLTLSILSGSSLQILDELNDNSFGGIVLGTATAFDIICLNGTIERSCLHSNAANPGTEYTQLACTSLLTEGPQANLQVSQKSRLELGGGAEVRGGQVEIQRAATLKLTTDPLDLLAGSLVYAYGSEATAAVSTLVGDLNILGGSVRPAHVLAASRTLAVTGAITYAGGTLVFYGDATDDSLVDQITLTGNFDFTDTGQREEKFLYFILRNGAVAAEEAAYTVIAADGTMDAVGDFESKFYYPATPRPVGSKTLSDYLVNFPGAGGAFDFSHVSAPLV